MGDDWGPQISPASRYRSRSVTFPTMSYKLSLGLFLILAVIVLGRADDKSQNQDLDLLDKFDRLARVEENSSSHKKNKKKTKKTKRKINRAEKKKKANSKKGKVKKQKANQAQMQTINIIQ